MFRKAVIVLITAMALVLSFQMQVQAQTVLRFQCAYPEKAQIGRAHV